MAVDSGKMLAWALGREKAPLVLKNGQLVNVLSGEIYPADIAVAEGIIVGVGEYAGEEEVDLAGRFVYPGLIDGHFHFESSMVCPEEFAAAVLPRGTTTVIADPHELANVWGVEGIKYFLEATENLPLNVFFTLPSCVPATDLEDNGARLEAEDLAPFFSHPRILGLGELMNVPGVLYNNPGVWAKIELAHHHGKIIDGHAPGFTGKELAAYRLAGVTSDHECISAAEGRERLRLGMHLMLREGSATKNLLDLLPAVNRFNVSQCILVTDDRHPDDLLAEGHMDHLLRMLVSHRVDPVSALQMATINTARYFKLWNYGAIAPGCQADLVVAEDLTQFKPYAVYSRGKLVASQGELVVSIPRSKTPLPGARFQMAPLKPEQLRIPAGNGTKAWVIGLLPHQIVTKKLLMEVPVVNGCFAASAAADIAKLMVAERHHRTGTVGVGLLHGFGLQEGAIASSVAHDSHNLVVVGMSDADMLLAADTVAQMGGGLAVVARGEVRGTLALPIGGLMSREPIRKVTEDLSRLRKLARELGVKEDYDPFMTLAFLSLPVIPELKLTNRGLVDVTEHKFISIVAS
ncbi:MAG TPA: adenine deaminase [Clostridia bacterium]|nr:adenine deaminase [Clostridia bacterium]